MKKVILGAAALMIGSFAFAQYTPSSPTQAVQISNQSVNTGANTGESVQNGNDQKVRVRQVGTSNSAATYQDDGTGTGGNLASISQNGAVGPTSGDSNLAETHQRGSVNQSTANQQGDGNSALTNQGLNNTASSGNKAHIQQGNNLQAEDNWAEVNQDGDDNQARTLQRWDNNEALTTQMGDRNKADIHQAAEPDSSEGHAAEVNQQGDDNQALLYQHGNGARNMATTIQIGNNNASFQVQKATGTSGDGNNALVDQGQGVNTTTIANDLYYNGLLNVDVINNGSFNAGSDNAIAVQNQTGTNNIAQASQFNSGNEATQIQEGDANRALIGQNAYGNANGESNRARQEQDGDDNDAAIGQNGSRHVAFQMQAGNDNTAMSTQRGEHNIANINQWGNQNWATTAQRGECNVAYVNQYDGQSYAVQQNLADGMSNGGNQADILQQGPGGTQTGSYLDPTNCDIPDASPGMFTDITDLTIGDLCPGCGI